MSVWRSRTFTISANAGTDVANPKPLSSHINTIIAALQVSAGDLLAIAWDAGLIAQTGVWNTVADPVAGGTITAGTTLIVTLTGTATAGDTVTLTVTSSRLGGPLVVSHTVASGDTLATIATALASSINANPSLSALHVSGTAQSSVVLINVLFWPGTPATVTVTRGVTPASATETVTITTGPAVTLENLSALYRYAALAQALTVSVTDLISLKRLSGFNPFQLAVSDPITGNAVQFVQAVQEVLASKFSPAQLNYLFRALPDAADSLPPLQADQEALLVSLSTGLQKVASTNAFTPDPSGTALRKKLGTLLNASQVGPTMGLIDGSAVYTSSLSSLPATVTRQASPNASQTTLVTVGGTVTVGDNVTLTLTLSGVAGSPVVLSYITVNGDTPGSIAAKLQAQISTNPALTAAGISATVAGAVITILTPLSLEPAQAWAATTTPSNATETITANDAALEQMSYLTNVTISGTVTAGDTVTLTLTLAGVPVSVSYQAASADTLGAIAANLTAMINGNLTMNAAGLTASVEGWVITISALLVLDPAPVLTASATPALATATETITIGSGASSNVATVGGTITPGDVVTLTLSIPSLAGSPVNFAHPVAAGDTPTSIAKALSLLITTSPMLSAAGIAAAWSGPAITVSAPPALSPTLVLTAKVTPAPAVATEVITPAGTGPGYTITVGGTATPQDVVTLTLNLFGGAGPSVSLAYPVGAGDTPSSIALALGGKININPILSAAGISATVTGAVISLSAPPTLSSTQVWSQDVAPATATEIVTIAGTALTSSGPMRDATYSNLLALSSSGGPFAAAVTDLYNQAQNVLSQNLYFLAPATTFTTSLAGLPSGVALPPVPPGQVVFSTGHLVCDGAMTNSTRTQLLALSSDPTFTTAVNALYSQAWTNVSAQLIDIAADSTPASRYNYVLQSLLYYLTATQSQNLVKQNLSQALALDGTLVALVLQGNPTTATAALLPSQSLLSTQPAAPMAARDPGLSGRTAGGLLFRPATGDACPDPDRSGRQPGRHRSRVRKRSMVGPDRAAEYRHIHLLRADAQWGAGAALGERNQAHRYGQSTGHADHTANSLASRTDLRHSVELHEPPTQAAIQLQWSNSSTAQQTIPARFRARRRSLVGPGGSRTVSCPGRRLFHAVAA